MADASATVDDSVVLMKATVIGPDVVSKADQASVSDPDEADAFYGLRDDFLEPPYRAEFLCRLFEHSNSLRQNVDAYKTNIDGFGHVFEPVIALRESSGRELVSDALYLERTENVVGGTPGAIALMTPPTDAQIDAKMLDIEYKMRLEKARVESFFDHCVADGSFVDLRRKTRDDLEVTGNGFWEVIRNDSNQVCQFSHMPSRSVRVSKQKSEMIGVPQKVRVGTLTFRDETFRRKFRRYMQIGGGKKVVYFKEYGDPSLVSDLSGKTYPDEATMAVEEPASKPATEVIHFKIHSVSDGAYGVPRWIGNMLSVMGSRSAEEVNYAYFENKSIPPMAILVSGGRLGNESVKRIQDFVELQIKGKKNFHKILVIEAETSAGAIGLADNASSMRVEIKQLTDAQLKDGLFLQYDAANMDKVGMGFRLPRLLRGDIRDFNRASAQAALEYAESQVFVPERNDFDFFVNRFILPALGILHWRFKSLGPRLSDSEDWGKMIALLTTAGILVPADARELASKKVLSTDLPVIKADWTKQPIALTIAGVQADNTLDGVIPLEENVSPAADPANMNSGGGDIGSALTPHPTLMSAAKQRVLNKAKELLKLRDAFRKVQEQKVVEDFKRERAEEQAAEELVIKMSKEEMQAVLGIVAE